MTFDAVELGGEGSGWRGELSISSREGILKVLGVRTAWCTKLCKWSEVKCKGSALLSF
jgi:hypothetical protein